MAARTAACLGALVLSAALITGGGPVEAKTSRGLRACDYRRDYDGIPCSEVDRAISESAAEFRVDETRLRSIVRCESSFNPRATRGSYKGLFQQLDDYWPERVGDFNDHHDPDVGNNIYSPFDNSRVSARMLAAGNEEDWRNCA